MRPPPRGRPDHARYVAVSTNAGAFQLGNPGGLTTLDVAYGMPLGKRRRRRLAPSAGSLGEAVERVFAGCFEQGRCYLPFSGGRESTMLLAVAASYARRHGHMDPVPVTLRFADPALAGQRRVQEQVIAHLALNDWESVDVDGQLDLVGPVARRILLRTGPMWPANAHMMVPLIEAAHDGVFVLVTGLMDFFAFWRWAPLAAVVAGQRRPRLDDLTLLAGTLMPLSLRARYLSRRMGPPPTWLRPAAEHRARALMARRQADVPVRFDHALMEQTTHRCFESATSAFQAIGEAVGTMIVQPLRRDDVVAAIAGAGGRRGFGDQRAMLERLCERLVPRELMIPRPVPSLTATFFADATRQFAAGWDGAGLDESIVDPEALRRTWLSDRPDTRTGCLLQYAWLSEQVRLHGERPGRPKPVTSQPTMEGAV
jgi:hypothetical protein